MLFQTKIIAGLGIALVLMSGASYLYIRSLRAENAASALQIVQLRDAIQTQEEAYKNLNGILESRSKTLAEVSDKMQAAEQENITLKNRMSDLIDDQSKSLLITPESEINLNSEFNRLFK